MQCGILNLRLQKYKNILLCKIICYYRYLLSISITFHCLHFLLYSLNYIWHRSCHKKVRINEGGKGEKMRKKEREREIENNFPEPGSSKEGQAIATNVFKSHKMDCFLIGTPLIWLISLWLEYCYKSCRALEREVLMPHSKLATTSALQKAWNYF